ncbi:MAG: rod shape-determining protein MreC [Sulfurovaceae bacterium]|nr:rod shape-determining protein MreC [Sulfurovaceae bacterium]
MKTKVITIFLLLVILIALILHNKNHIINSNFQSKLSPLKKFYINTVDDIKSSFNDYINQKRSIEKYKKENEELKLQLLDQLNYIDESKKLYKVFPALKKMKLNKNIDLVQTISYIKFNNFSQIILTKPDKLEENRIYGLIQNGVVGGVARVENNQLIGYLPNDGKSRFSVFVGKASAPGIAIGSGDRYATVQFIPKWFNIKIGDKVVTSGLDGIFYGDIPVGIVKQVELQGNFKVAHIEIYGNAFNPKIFFLVKNIKPVLYDSNLVNYARVPTSMMPKDGQMQDLNKSLPGGQKPASLSSTPLVEIDQTREYEIDTTKQMQPNGSTSRVNDNSNSNSNSQSTEKNTDSDNKNSNKENLELLNSTN